MNLDKPFKCEHEGCEMSFSTSYFMSIHQKKHEIDLINLALFTNYPKQANKTDETPTPTRFIRTCEEVGLFQDLQNMNPFDETFKNALENKENGTRHALGEYCEDPLNTPHILPHIQSTRDANRGKESDSFSMSDDVLEIVTSSDDDLDDDVEIILENGKKDGYFDECESDRQFPENEVVVLRNNKPSSINIYDKLTPESEKRREMNRMAQLRFRQKKKTCDESYVNEMKELKSANERLIAENQILRIELEKLKRMLGKPPHLRSDTMSPIVKEIHKTINIPVQKPILPRINSVGTLKGMMVVPNNKGAAVSSSSEGFKVPLPVNVNNNKDAKKTSTFVTTFASSAHNIDSNVKRQAMTMQDKIVIIKKLKKV